MYLNSRNFRCNVFRKIMNLLLIIILLLFQTFCNNVEPNYQGHEKTDSINIQNWNIFTTENSGISANSIKVLEVDNQNNLWIGTFSNGLIRYNGISWEVFDTSNSNLPSNCIRSLTVDKNNTIWIGTINGLANYDGINWTIYNTSNSILTYDVISTLAVDNNNVLWIGCGHLTAGGVFTVEGKNWNSFTKENSALPSSIINVIHIDIQNNKWIGTAAGVVKIDDQNNWNVYSKNNSNLLFGGINAITTDFDDNVWLGANELEKLDFEHYYGGLQKFDGKIWFNYSPHLNGVYNPNAKTSNRVDHLICDKSGYLLIATETEGKYPYNLSFFKNGVWKNISDIIEGFPTNLFVRDIKFDKNNTLWMATQLGVISINYSVRHN